MITFTPLAGGARSNVSRPLCYLLVIDDTRILLDCGDFPHNASDELRESYYDALEKSVSRPTQHRSDADLPYLQRGENH